MQADATFWDSLVFDGLDVDVEVVTAAFGAVDVTARGRGASAACPDCGHSLNRVHDSYQRGPKDLPLAGQSVVIHLTVRRFICGTDNCPRRTFAEPFAQLTAPYARFTTRLGHVLERVGLALAGRAGARLTAQLGFQVGRMTLLRRVMALPDPQPSTPRVLGVDDFATRRGQTYSTVLTCGETHRVVDVLPTRDSGPLAAWLAAHPGVAIICRDRAGAYAEGARLGAPTAIQVADRFHLWQGIGRAVETCVAAHRACLNGPTPPTRADVGASANDSARGGPDLDEGRARPGPRTARSGALARLHGELIADNAPVTYQMVRAYIAALRATPPQAASPPPTVRRVTGWLTRHPATLSEDERAALKDVLARCPELDAAAEHVRGFGEILTHRLGSTLTAWIDAVDASQLPGLTNFALHLLRDLDAVTAGLTLHWSSGGTEGGSSTTRTTNSTAGPTALATRKSGRSSATSIPRKSGSTKNRCDHSSEATGLVTLRDRSQRSVPEPSSHVQSQSVPFVHEMSRPRPLLEGAAMPRGRCPCDAGLVCDPHRAATLRDHRQRPSNRQPREPAADHRELEAMDC